MVEYHVLDCGRTARKYIKYILYYNFINILQYCNILQLLVIYYITSISAVRGGPGRISILYWMRLGMSPLRIRKRQTFWMSSLHPSLKVRPVILRFLQSLTWQCWLGSWLNPPQFRKKQSETCYSNWTATSPWDRMRFTRECWGNWRIAEPLSIIYQRSLLMGEVPEDWRLANVIPIYKKGRKEDLGNYRTVSLTSVPGKVME